MKRRDFIKNTVAGSTWVGLGGWPLNGFSQVKTKHLTILHTNDVHSHIDPFPANHPKNPNMGGVVKRAVLIEKIRQENPNVVALYNQLHSKGLNIIGVSLDKDKAKWKEAIAQDKLVWTQVSNLKFWDEPIARQYKVESIPATFILDANGKVVAQDLRGEALKAKVLSLLAK